MSDTANRLRSYLLTDEEAETAYVIFDHVIDETILAGLADERLIASAVALRDRFKPQEDDQ